MPNVPKSTADLFILSHTHLNYFLKTILIGEATTDNDNLALEIDVLGNVRFNSFFTVFFFSFQFLAIILVIFIAEISAFVLGFVYREKVSKELAAL